MPSQALFLELFRGGAIAPLAALMPGYIFL